MKSVNAVPANMVIVSPALYQVITRRVEEIEWGAAPLFDPPPLPFVGRLYATDVCVNPHVADDTIHGQEDDVRWLCRTLGWEDPDA